MVGTEANITVTSYDTLEGETNGTLPKVPKTGNTVPYGLAGVVAGGEVLCHVCASDEQLRDDEGDEAAVFGNAEWDYPGAICDDCGTPLDTFILVYESHNPKLHYRLKMTESVGKTDEIVLSIEEIAERANKEAYLMGYADMDMMNGEYGEGGEYEGNFPEVPTDSAKWANVTAPKIRALAGYVDPTSKGTFTTCPNDDAYHIHEELVNTYRGGYYDAAKGHESQY